MNAFTVYLFFLADNLYNSFTIITLILGIALVPGIAFTIISFFDSNCSWESETYRQRCSNYFKIGKKWLKRIGISFLIGLAVATLMPDTKTLTAMYIIPKIVNNQDIKKMPDYLIKYINTILIKKTKENKS